MDSLDAGPVRPQGKKDGLFQLARPAPGTPSPEHHPALAGGRFPSLVATALLLFLSTAALAESPLTLAEALREARAHNAALPVAELDTSVAAANVEAAEGRLWPTVGIDGDFHDGAPSRYASGDARLQVVASLPLYDGGRLRANLHEAEAGKAASTARFHVAERDLDYQVTTSFSQAIEFREEIALGEHALERLRRYVELVEARRRSGQPLASDLLKVEVERDRQAADLVDRRRQLAASLLELSDLLGRDLHDPIRLAPLPAPVPPRAASAEPWANAPEIAAAEAEQWSARTAVASVRAERLPHLDLAANAGAQPVVGSSFEAPLNNGRDLGAEVILSLSWPLWDRGVYEGDLSAARLALDRSARKVTVARREARLQWTRARADVARLYEVVQLRASALPTAEDAYLQAESLYRGGATDALHVLDAYDQWIQAGLDAARARLDFRLAEAREARWGGR